MLKRIITVIVGFSIIFSVFYLDFLYSNLGYNGALFFNIAIAICSFLMCHEFYKAVSNKGIKPIKWLGYLCTLFILPIGVFTSKFIMMICATVIPLIIVIGLAVSVISNIKYNIIDVSVTIFGAIYTVLMMAFMSATRALDNGVYSIFYIFGGAWFSDIFAFLIGRKFGKHKFSEISPKKSIEGCIAGIFGTIVFFVGYTYALSKFGINIYIFDLYLLVPLSIIVSIFSQIGDFSASSIKRYSDIKDFSHLMPGHGGMLDRFDSILFVAPIIYYSIIVEKLFS